MQYKNANMAQNDSQWHKMTLNGSEWLRMTQNDSKGLREAQNDSIWLKMQCCTKRKNGSELKMTQKWLKMV